MKRLKKEISLLLVAALVVSSLVLGFGQLQASAVSQAAGQTASYRFQVSTSAQDCNGTGTANNCTITIYYVDGTNWSNTIAGESSPNYFEAGATDNIDFSGVPAKPISSINMNSTGGDRWKTGGETIFYSPNGGTTWWSIATMGGFDSGAQNSNFTYPSTYSLNTASLNKTLTFNGGGGSPASTQIYSEYGASLPAGNIPSVSRTGYTFAGWSPTVPSTGPSADATYTATWNVNYYTITWDANGGNGGGSNSCAYGSTPTAISAGTRTGYTFTSYPGVTTCTGPATYTAQWTQNDYTFTFDANGGTGGTSGTLHYGDAVTVPTVSKTGSTFAGWAEGTPPATMPANNIYYTAQWTQNDYTYTFDANGGTGGTSGTLHYGDSISAPSVSWTGHTFTSWSPSVPATMPAADSTYTAQWTQNDYTYSFDATSGGSGSTSGTLHYGDALPVPTVTKTGYTFAGWSPSAPPSTMPNSNVAYTATWTLNSYQITWAPGANGTGGGTNSCNYGATPTPMTVTPNTGYQFAAWTPTIAAATGNTTYTATWTPIIYTISFTSNGGSAVTSIQQNYNTQVLSAPTAPTKAGNNFVGWYSDSGLTNAVTWPYTITGDVTFYAKWSVNSYTINFNSDGGSAVSSITQAYGSTVTPPAAPTKTGYTFNGWSPDCPSTMPVGGENCVAQWVPKQYTVSFDSDSGSAVAYITQNYNTSVTKPVDPTKTGNTFVGWYSDSGLTNAVTWPYTLGAADVTFYAKWSINSYTITWDANGGSGGGTNSSNHGATPTPMTVTADTGYHFVAWTPTIAAATGDTTYTATWAANTYTVTFNANGGSTPSPASKDVTYAGTYGTLATTSLSGYTFAGWWTAASGGTQVTSSTTVAITSAQTLYAHWTANTYTITYEGNGNTSGSTDDSSHTYNAWSNLTTNGFEKTGNTFLGWSTASDATAADYGDGDSVSNLTTTSGGIVTFYAVWAANNYNITFDANGGNGGTGPDSMTYGTTLSAPTVTRTGYTFSSWSPTVPATVPAENKTYTAQWIKNQSTITFDLNGGTSAEIDPITLDEGATVTAPADPTLDGYTFAGWDPVVPATMPVDDVACVAQWTIVSTEPVIVPAPDSPTVIDDVKQSIYGLTEGISQADFESSFVGVTGNGRLEITTLDGNIGTGTRVDLIDNATDEVVKTYYIVIFGDINGDGIVGSTDADIINNYENFAVEWNAETQPYLFTASDLNGDGNSEAVDADIVNNVENFNMWINQATGFAYEY